jgi:YhcH/YjgK/YiaL family protein
MKKFLFSSFLPVVLVISFSVQAQKGPKASTSKAATNWFNKKQWANGLQLNAHSSTNAQEFKRQYDAHKAWWDTAFAFLKTNDLPNLAPGKYKLVGDSVYVSVTEGPLKDFDQTQWESHRKYIDVQYVARGKEKIGVVPVAKATVTEPYNEAKDVAHYKSEGTYYVAEPGTFFIFFPEDAHRPSIKVEEGNEKKVVVKVMTAQ